MTPTTTRFFAHLHRASVDKEGEVTLVIKVPKDNQGAALSLMAKTESLLLVSVMTEEEARRAQTA